MSKGFESASLEERAGPGVTLHEGTGIELEGLEETTSMSMPASSERTPSFDILSSSSLFVRGAKGGHVVLVLEAIKLLSIQQSSHATAFTPTTSSVSVVISNGKSCSSIVVVATNLSSNSYWIEKPVKN